MTKALTKQEFSLYSLLYSKFGNKEFGLDSLRWYFSRQMLKKLIFGLGEKGWIISKERGSYACISPNEAVSSFFYPQAEKALEEAKISYCFTKATAAEIWSDESYVQRSWEFSPFFIKVLKTDLKTWKRFFAYRDITFFEGSPSNTVGEFVVLVPVSSMKVDFHSKKPVEPLKETIAFCEANKESFEYVLAYLADKYGVKTTASKEMLVKAEEAL